MAPVLDTNILIDITRGNKNVENVIKRHSKEKQSITMIFDRKHFK